MSDLISRKAVMNHIENEYRVWGDEYDALQILGDLEDMPSAEPKRGKWIDFSDEGYVECPYCHSATNCDDNKEELHYCYSCGADMRGSE